MDLLKFDPSGALHSEYGISRDQIAALKPTLQQIRSEFATIDPSEYPSGKIPAEKQPLDTRFLSLPEEQLAAYVAQREQSELGRIFKVAQRLHHTVDAVVVLGSGCSYLGVRALMDAGCHPYHNELSRGRRGSKPRMYFEGNHVDNEATASLLDRLSDIRNGDPLAKRWAICVISKSGENLETAVAFRNYLAALEKQLGPAALLAEFVVPVTGARGKLLELATALGCKDIFEVPGSVSGRFSVLSAVGLLPAAVLGLDCMQLLKGAVAMTNHFHTAAFEDNVVLQYVAVNHLLERHRGANIRVLSIWSQALQSVGQWYDQLLAESLGQAGLKATPWSTVPTRELHSRHQQGQNDKVFHNLIVRDCRVDLISIGRSARDQDGLNELAEKTLADVMSAAILGANDALHAAGRPTTDLVLPQISMHVLGQLFQMLMLATVVEGRLLGINPYGQPGVEQYKQNMNRNLGRIGLEI